MQKVVRDLIDDLGFVDAIEIVRRYGGRRLDVPVTLRESDPLALSLGFVTAGRLVKCRGGERLELPSERRAVLDMRNEAIFREWNGGKGKSLTQLGHEYGLRRQGVSFVISKMVSQHGDGTLQTLAGGQPACQRAESAATAS